MRLMDFPNQPLDGIRHIRLGRCSTSISQSGEPKRWAHLFQPFPHSNTDRLRCGPSFWFNGLNGQPQLAACLVILLTLSFLNGSEAVAQSGAGRSFESVGNEFITPQTQKAIEKGIVFLSRNQQNDGSFGSGGRFRSNVAVTSLAGMAFLSAGHVPGRGPYGKNLDRAIDNILANTKPSGFIKREGSGNSDHGPMYGHGFATLFLAEIYGMTQKNEVRDALKSATQLIINSQNKEGGWRYEPTGTDADVSVTVCQMMALRAARNCGIAVPKTTVDRCVEYVKKCQNSDGGFRYQLYGNRSSDFPRSAGGVVVLYNAGVVDGRDLQRGLEYLSVFRPRGDSPKNDPHYFYGQYYAAQAMWHAGDDYWRQWYPAIRDELLIRQLPADGSWFDPHINVEYGTAMACLILQMPNNVLPIFQR